MSRELSLTIATANDQTLVTLPESAKWWDGGDKANTLTVTSNQRLMPDKGRLQCVIEPAKNSVACFDIRQIEILEKGISPTLIATDYKGGKAVMADKEPLCFENNLTDARLKEVPVAPTVLSRWGTGGNNTPLVINGKKNVCPTLEANLFNKNTFQDCEKYVVEEADAGEPIAFIKNDAGGEQQGYWEGVFPTMRSQVTPAIAYNVTFCDANGKRKDRPDGGLYVTEAETSKTVTTGRNGVLENGECVPLDLRNATRDPEKHNEMNRQGVGVGANGEPMNTITAGAVPGVGWQATVRRLTPLECERLMGFPDGHTMIPWKGKPAEECPDAPRYKACGNSMCVNVMRWIGMRIEILERKLKNA